MNIIHVFWSPILDGEENRGQFYLWVESSTQYKQQNLHPYQMKHEDLAELILSMKWDKQRKKLIDPITVQFPSDNKGEALLSPLIANLCNLDDRSYFKHVPHTLQVLRIENPFSFLKELNYQQFSFEENTILGEDTKFWIQMLCDFSHVVKKDDYIPAIVALNNPLEKRINHLTYRNQWEIISADFDARLQQLADAMPLSACLGLFSNYHKASALHHVADVLINELLTTTRFSKKIDKDITGTAIDGCFIGYNKSDIVDDSDWIALKEKITALNAEYQDMQHGSSIKNEIWYNFGKGNTQSREKGLRQYCDRLQHDSEVLLEQCQSMRTVKHLQQHLRARLEND